MNERTLGTPERGVYSKPWMPRGCELCYPGSKAVIFVTGLCDDSCYYCPVSRERLGKDVFQVNERRVSSVYEVVEEIERAGAQGASITGGDPLVKASRTIEVIRVLKEVFGRRFHIHLYTSGRYAGSSLLARLAEAGLDEIRFHPTRPGFIEAASRAKRVGSWSVGFEIPVAPALKEWAWEIVLKAEELGVEFVNLNEMEVTQDNINDIIMKGMLVNSGRPVVEGALQAGLAIVKKAVSSGFRVNVHFCPAYFKDAIQTRNRFRRTARRDVKPFEKTTRQGTIIYGVLEGGKAIENIIERTNICFERIDATRIATIPEPGFLASIAKTAGARALIVETHPTVNREPVVEEIVVYDGSDNTFT